jgi:hypothetical protein
MKRLIVFHLDGRLAPSKSPLHELPGRVRVAVVSGGGWSQFEKQLLPRLAGASETAAVPVRS